MMDVLICYGTPSPRAVIVGRVDAEPVIDQPVTVHNARMVLWWSAATGGLLGLAAHGPREGCRITATVERHSVVAREVMTLSPEAVAALAVWPEWRG